MDFQAHNYQNTSRDLLLNKQAIFWLINDLIDFFYLKQNPTITSQEQILEAYLAF